MSTPVGGSGAARTRELDPALQSKRIETQARDPVEVPAVPQAEKPAPGVLGALSRFTEARAQDAASIESGLQSRSDFFQQKQASSKDGGAEGLGALQGRLQAFQSGAGLGGNLAHGFGGGLGGEEATQAGQASSTNFDSSEEMSVKAEEAFRKIEGLLSEGFFGVSASEALQAHDILMKLEGEDFCQVLKSMGASENSELLSNYFQSVGKANSNRLADFAQKFAEDGTPEAGQALLQGSNAIGWSHFMEGVRSASELSHVSEVALPEALTAFDRNLFSKFEGDRYDGLTRMQAKNLDAALESKLHPDRSVASDKLSEAMKWTKEKAAEKLAEKVFDKATKGFWEAADKVLGNGLSSLHEGFAEMFLQSVRGSDRFPTAKSKFIEEAQDAGLTVAQAQDLLMTLRGIYHPAETP